MTDPQPDRRAAPPVNYVMRGLNIGNFVGVVGLVAAVFIWGFDVKEQVAVNEVKLNYAVGELARLSLVHQARVKETDETIKANREWQVDQRIRVWNTVREVNAQMQSMKIDIATMKALLIRVEKKLDRRDP